MEVTGTSSDDVLQGSAGDDRMFGLDGGDELNGGEGDDYLVGGEETEMDRSDTLLGNAGNDTLLGGAYYDFLHGGEGDDQLEGGSDNDYLYPGTGNNVARGGDGNDSFTLMQGRDTLYGGAGDDTFSWIGDPATGQGVIDGGDGDDIFYADWGSKTEGSSFLITGGAGRDLFYLSGYSSPEWTGVFPLVNTITDFTQGTDLIRFTFAMAVDFPGNPFGSLGYLRLEQRGADTVVHYDRDGAAGNAHTWYEAAILKGITAADLNRNSFAGYLDPGGSAIGANVTGGSGSEEFQGGPLNDMFSGGDGADHINGGAGNDTIIGGDESAMWSFGGDFLFGGYGHDTLQGGTGNDDLNGSEGDDSLEGGAGDDDLDGGAGNDVLSGGDGNDDLQDHGGANTMLGGAGDDNIFSRQIHDGYFDGGDGNDSISAGGGSDTLLGGAGDDILRAGLDWASPQVVPAAPTLMDGGQGADTFYFDFNADNRVVATGGAGVDTFAPMNRFVAVAEITDFTAGPGGDVIDFQSWDPSWSQSQVNPFGESGYARMSQSGADTVIELDRDGALGTGYQFEQVFVLRGVSAADLTSDNFSGSAARTGPLGVTLAGDGDAEVLVGTGSADRIEGMDGNDRLVGGGENDHLDGGGGNDILSGGTGSDTLAGGAGFDHAEFKGNFADYEVSAGTVTDSRGYGTDTLSGIERLVFDDAWYAFDIEGVAGQAYRLYQAAFNRTPDLAGLGYWIGAGDRGLPLVDMSAMFFLSPEFDALYGASQTNEQLVRLFYVNALHRQPDEPGVAYWTDLLDRGVATPAIILTGFSESAENKAATAPVIGEGFKFDPTYY